MLIIFYFIHKVNKRFFEGKWQAGHGQMRTFGQAGGQSGTFLFRHLAINFLILNLHILIKAQNSCQIHTKFSRSFLFSSYILFSGITANLYEWIVKVS
jgi:hypothetical protein